MKPRDIALAVAVMAFWGVNFVVIATGPLRFMIWASAVACGPLIVLSLLIDGPRADLAALRAVDAEAVGAVLYAALVATLAGFGAWGHLLKRHGATTVAPFSLLVPFFGIASAALLLGERIHAVDVAGGVLVVGGILVGLARPPVPAKALVRVEP